MTALTNLLDLSPEQLVAYCNELGEKPFRATQLQRWMHVFGESDFDAMTNLAKSLRSKLAGRAYVGAPAVISDSTSSDGTRKWLLDVGGGNAIETVFIPEDNRGTLCISTQAGCAVNCRFCSTGKQGFSRNLTTAEIIGQLWIAEFALRNFGMDWWRSMTLEAVNLFGPLDGRYLSGLSATLIGLHYYERTSRTLGITGNDPESFGRYMLRMARGQGEDASMDKDGDAVIIRQSDWRMMKDRPDPHPVVFEAWNCFWEGLLSSHNPGLRLDVRKRMDLGDDCFEWRISRRRPSTIGKGAVT